MNTQIQRVKAEIERRLDEINKMSEGVIVMTSVGIEYKCLKELLEFINSLPEEPVSKDIEQDYQESICKQHAFTQEEMAEKCIKESASEDLEEEINEYISINYQTRFDEVLVDENDEPLTVFDFKNIATHFANWQKEQMMKSTVNTEILLVHNGAMFLSADCKSPFDIIRGDKLKIIIVKED